MLHSGVADQYFIFHEEAKNWLDYWIARKGNRLFCHEMHMPKER
jgi:hypothetical protein